MKSISADDGTRCVDIFLRPDGTYGFEEYRRDAEDACGWFPVGFYGDEVFSTEADTVDEAIRTVTWLESPIDPAPHP